MSGVKIEIMDTGSSSKNVSEGLWTPTNEWINIYATTLRVEEDVIKTNHESRRFDGQMLYAPKNEPTSVMSQRLYINGQFPLDKINDLKLFRQMGRTLGLKKIRGGLGLISTCPGVTSGGELYINILSIKPSEVLSQSTSSIGYIMHVEIVEEE